jgi:predicted secreted protein
MWLIIKQKQIAPAANSLYFLLEILGCTHWYEFIIRSKKKNGWRKSLLHIMDG